MNANISEDVTRALNAEREARIKEAESKSARADEGFVRSKDRLSSSEESHYSYLTEGSHTFDSDFGFITLKKYYYSNSLENAKLAMLAFFKEECHISPNLSKFSDESLFGGLRYGHNDDSMHEVRIISL